MKINILNLFIMCIISIGIIPSKALCQDSPSAGVSSTVPTPTEGSVFDVFANRTLEQEEVIEIPAIQHSSVERLYTLRIGQVSPATGTLFNIEAVAWLDVNNSFVANFYMTQLNFRLNQLRTEARLHVQSLQLQLNTERSMSELRINDLNSQLALERQISTELRTGSIPASERRHFHKRTAYITIGAILITAIVSTSITCSIASCN